MTRFVFLSAALAIALLAGFSAQAQQAGPDKVKKEAKEAQRDVRKPMADEARKPVNRTPDAARDRAKDARDTAKDRAKDATKDKDTAKDAAKDRAKDTAKDPAKDRAKDTAKDARDAAKDRRGDKPTARDDRKDDKADDKTAAKPDRKFSPDKVKPDDVGLSLKEESDEGLTISTVHERGPMARVGFQRGDRIVSVNGRRIARQADFFRFLFADDIRDQRVRVIVVRGGREQVVFVEPRVIVRHYETVVVDDDNPIHKFGLVMDNRDGDERLIVRKVIDGSPADRAGIRESDEILAVNDQPVDTRREFARLLTKFEGERLELKIRSDRQAKVIEAEFVR